MIRFASLSILAAPASAQYGGFGGFAQVPRPSPGTATSATWRV